MKCRNKMVKPGELLAVSLFALSVMAPAQAANPKSVGVISIQVRPAPLCEIVIESEKPMSNIIFDLGLVSEEKVEYIYVTDKGVTTATPLGTEYTLGSYADDISYQSIHVKAGNNGKRGVGAEIELEVQIEESCEVQSYAIGDKGPEGGWVFHVTNDGLNGLEAAAADQSPAQWGCRGKDIEGIENTTSFPPQPDTPTGADKTESILKECTERPIAASVASDYIWSDGQTGGYLPDHEELDMIFDNIGPGCDVTANPDCNVGGFAFGGYWSSSEFDGNLAWFQGFLAGYQNSVGKGYPVNTLSVRAVRAF